MYQISVVAKHKTLLATTTILVWCKDSDITEHDMEEWVKEWNDLGHGQMIIATTADIMPDAVKMADMYGIQWFDWNDLKRWKEDGMHVYGHVRYLNSLIYDSEAESRAKKIAGKKPKKGGLIPQKSNVAVREVLPFYYTYYDAIVTYMISDVTGRFREKNVRNVVRIRVTVDARSGGLVVFDNGRIKYGLGISPAEMRILSAAGKKVTRNTQKQSCLSPEAFDQAMRGLIEKGIVTVLRRDPPESTVNEPFPKKPKPVTECGSEPTGDPGVTAVKVTVLPDAVIDILRELGGTVTRIDITHLSHYRIKCDVEGTTKTVFLNARTGEQVQDEGVIKSMQDGLPNGDGDDWSERGDAA